MMLLETKDYSKLQINGMHYVREIKCENGMKPGFIILNGENKPVKNAYHFLKQCRKDGNKPSSAKRKAYDLCYFLDFLYLNNIDEETVNYEYFLNFVSTYLRIINPKPMLRDCIERSMLDSIPILPEYKDPKIKVVDRNKTKGLDTETIKKIANVAKNYLIFLHRKYKYEIELNEIFREKYVKFRNDSMLGYLEKGVVRKYTLDNILKGAGLPNTKEFINPIDIQCIFEPDEESRFFSELNKNSGIAYQLLFYIVSRTGMRISEALGLRVRKVINEGMKIDFITWDSDIVLINDSQDAWRINIVVRSDSPPDINIKNNKPRTIELIDKTKQLRNLLTQMVLYRNIKIRKKNIKTEFLFVNRSGKRLKYQVTKQRFDKILKDCGLADRKGQLVIHSFRHTFASTWINLMEEYKADVELEELSRYLGHSSSDVTKKVYLHLFKDDRLRILEKMEKAKHQTGGE